MSHVLLPPVAATALSVAARMEPEEETPAGTREQGEPDWQDTPAGQFEFAYAVEPTDLTPVAPRANRAQAVTPTLCLWPTSANPRWVLPHASTRIVLKQDGTDVSDTFDAFRMWRGWRADLDPDNREQRVGDYVRDFLPAFGVDGDSVGAGKPSWTDVPGVRLTSRPQKPERLLMEFIVGPRNIAPEPGAIYYIVIVDLTPRHFRIRLSKSLTLDAATWKYVRSRNSIAFYLDDEKPGMDESTMTALNPNPTWQSFGNSFRNLRGETLVVFELGGSHDSKAFVGEMAKKRVRNATPAKTRNFRRFPTPMSEWAAFPFSRPAQWWFRRLVAEAPEWFYMSGHIFGTRFSNSSPFGDPNNWSAEFDSPTSANNEFWKGFQNPGSSYFLNESCWVALIMGCTAINSPTGTDEAVNVQEMLSEGARRPTVLGFAKSAPASTATADLMRNFVTELNTDWNNRFDPAHLAASWLRAGESWNHANKENLGYLHPNKNAYEVNSSVTPWKWRQL